MLLSSRYPDGPPWWKSFPAPTVIYPLFLKYCGSVTQLEPVVSRKYGPIVQTWDVSGRRPVSSTVRLGAQRAAHMQSVRDISDRESGWLVMNCLRSYPAGRTSGGIRSRRRRGSACWACACTLRHRGRSRAACRPPPGTCQSVSGRVSQPAERDACNQGGVRHSQALLDNAQDIFADGAAGAESAIRRRGDGGDLRRRRGRERESGEHRWQRGRLHGCTALQQVLGMTYQAPACRPISVFSSFFGTGTQITLVPMRSLLVAVALPRQSQPEAFT